MPLFFLLQSKGLEWDVVFIVKVLDHIGLLASLAMLKWLHLYYTTIILWKWFCVIMNFFPYTNLFEGIFALMLSSMTQANESEIPLLHEFNGVAKENGNSIEVICVLSWNIVFLFFSFMKTVLVWHWLILFFYFVGGKAPVICCNDSCSEEAFHSIYHDGL